MGNYHRVPVHGSDPISPLPSFHTQSNFISKNFSHPTCIDGFVLLATFNTGDSCTTLPSNKTPYYRCSKHGLTVNRYTKDSKFTGDSYTKELHNLLDLLPFIKFNYLKLRSKKNKTNSVVVSYFGVKK